MQDGTNRMAETMADGSTRGADLADLVSRAAAGDAGAFEELYRRHAGRVHAVCLRLGRDLAQAEDCTQETFIRAWRALPRFESRSAFGTWLHRIAVNVVLEQRRRPGPALEFGDELPAGTIEPALPDTPVEEAELEAAIASLPEGARDALVLCAIHGYTAAEAGAMLGLAEGTCKAQLHRARLLLRARLESGVAARSAAGGPG
jgi:RNA polymerase sigma-70 factor (ECF subfamily)